MSAAPLDPTKAEEFRLRQQIQQNPPGKPAHGIFLLGPDGEPVALKADKIHEKLRQKLRAIRKKDNSVTGDIKALITELHYDFQQLNRIVNAIDYHWRYIEDDIACAYGYASEDDALKMLGIIYSDEEKAWSE